MLELDAERELAGTVSRILRGLRSAEDTERRVVNLRGRRSEVGVIEHVGECGLEPHSDSLRDVEHLGETQASCDRARSLQGADSGVAEASGASGRGRKCGQVEVVSAGLSLIEIIRDLVRTQESSAIDHISV